VGEMNPDRGGGGICVFYPRFNLSNSELQINFDSQSGGKPRVHSRGRWKLLLGEVQGTLIDQRDIRRIPPH
jgi:hypothetical protein